MDEIKLWNDVSKNIQFFTSRTAEDIPQNSGIYAWFLPFWIYKDNIETSLDFVQKAMLFDSKEFSLDNPKRGLAERDVNLSFNWDSIDINVKKNKKKDDLKISGWENIKENNEVKSVFTETLMKGSIFSRPLYLGRTNNLNARYNQHLIINPDKSCFNTRFNYFVENYNIDKNSSEKVSLRVDDLIFACISISKGQNELFEKSNVTETLEKILINIAQPPFSNR